jgi:hypothetical protein
VNDLRPVHAYLVLTTFANYFTLMIKLLITHYAFTKPVCSNSNWKSVRDGKGAEGSAKHRSPVQPDPIGGALAEQNGARPNRKTNPF